MIKSKYNSYHFLFPKKVIRESHLSGMVWCDDISWNISSAFGSFPITMLVPAISWFYYRVNELIFTFPCLFGFERDKENIIGIFRFGLRLSRTQETSCRPFCVFGSVHVIMLKRLSLILDAMDISVSKGNCVAAPHADLRREISLKQELWKLVEWCRWWKLAQFSSPSSRILMSSKSGLVGFLFFNLPCFAKEASNFRCRPRYRNLACHNCTK